MKFMKKSRFSHLIMSNWNARNYTYEREHQHKSNV